MAFNNAGLGEFGRDADWRSYPSLTEALTGKKHFLRGQLGSLLDSFSKKPQSTQPSKSVEPPSMYSPGYRVSNGQGLNPDASNRMNPYASQQGFYQQKEVAPQAEMQNEPVAQSSWANMSYGHP